MVIGDGISWRCWDWTRHRPSLLDVVVGRLGKLDQVYPPDARKKAKLPLRGKRALNLGQAYVHNLAGRG